ncbi:MAG: hypothetical protein ACHP7I_00030 [Terriglobales bacterium]
MSDNDYELQLDAIEQRLVRSCDLLERIEGALADVVNGIEKVESVIDNLPTEMDSTLALDRKMDAIEEVLRDILREIKHK